MAKRRNWTCPSCGTTWAIPAAATDPEICPKCREAESSATPAFDPDDALRQLSFERSMSPKLQTVSSLQFGDLFDWKFERYLTPLIFRLAWMMFVSLFLLNCIFMAVDFGFSMATEKSLIEAISDRADGNAAGDGPKLNRGGRVNTERAAVIVRTSIALIISIFSLLFFRVACELMIVIFNISTTLQHIERNIRVSPAA